jgi:sirohydrochlorin cobaltochelatase
MAAQRSALILFSHGARDPEWAAPIRKLQVKVSAQRPDLAVEVAFLELTEPLLPAAIEKLVAQDFRRIAIVPVFLAQGGHLKNDVPRLLGAMNARFPGITFELWPALGDVDPVLDAISAWIVNTAPR